MASPEYSITFASALPWRMYSIDSSFRMKSFAVTFSRLLAADDDLHRLGHLHAHVLGEPRVEDVGGADAESHTAHRAHVRRVRVGADIQLPGQRIGLGDDGVADALRAFAVGQLAVQPNAARLGEIFLLQLQLRREIEQAHLALLFRQHFVEKRQVIAEEQDACRRR